jgi:hypothetical protein
MSSAEQASLRLNARSEASGWGMRCDTQLQFTTAKLNALRDLWLDKARNGLPMRADFDARALKSYLGNLAIVERIDGPRYRLRYFGTEFVHLFGEQSNRCVDEFVRKPNLERWEAGYEAVLQGGAPLRFLSYFEIPQVSYLNGESFSAPLSNGSDAPNMILSAMYFLSKNAQRAKAG